MMTHVYHLCVNICSCFFLQLMDIIKHISFKLMASYQLTVFVEWLVHRPDLPSVLLVAQEIYDQLFTLILNVYILQKPVYAP